MSSSRKTSQSLLDGVSLSSWRQFLSDKRWFGAKERRIAGVDVVGVMPFDPDDAAAAGWALLEVSFQDGGRHTYQAPFLTLTNEGEVTEVFQLARFWSQLRDGFRQGHLPFAGGRMVFRGGVEWGNEAPKISVSSGETSNTLLRVDGGFIVKVYRRIRTTAHPEVESLEILYGQGFPHIARPFGSVLLHGQYGAALLEGSPLLLVVEDLEGFESLWEVFSGAQERNPLSDLAARLGTVTAEMHQAFYAAGEVAGGEERQWRFDDDLQVVGQLAAARTELRDDIADDIGRLVDAVLEQGDEITSRLVSALPGRSPSIRTHGDYHLGQILWRQADRRLAIIDFEGEPAREPTASGPFWPATRDVGCLLRSFSYSRYCSGKEPSWEARLRRSFLESYCRRMNGSPLIPAEANEFLQWVEKFELQKALNEISYELTHRPDWLRVPLQGVLAILKRRRERSG